jgi:hypothetical protein
LVHCRLRFDARKAVRLDALQGSAIRGGFGAALRRLVCIDLRLDCARCELRFVCPYTRVFNPFVPPGAARLRKNLNIPRPFVVKPPLGVAARAAGEPLEIDLVVVGEAAQYLPYMVVAFREVAERGLGSNRAPCVLREIDRLGPDGEAVDRIYDRRTGTIQPPRRNWTWRELLERWGDPGEVESLRVRFLTPTALWADGNLVPVPEFHHLIRRLRDRVNALATFYCGGPLDMDFKGMAERAREIRLIKSSTRWIAAGRRSRRGGEQDLSGFVGQVTYQGNIKPFLPLLALGEYVHVGKGAAFGNGWYTLAEPARAAAEARL